MLEAPLLVHTAKWDGNPDMVGKLHTINSQKARRVFSPIVL